MLWQFFRRLRNVFISDLIPVITMPQILDAIIDIYEPDEAIDNRTVHLLGLFLRGTDYPMAYAAAHNCTYYNGIDADGYIVHYICTLNDIAAVHTIAGDIKHSIRFHMRDDNLFCNVGNSDMVPDIELHEVLYI